MGNVKPRDYTNRAAVADAWQSVIIMRGRAVLAAGVRLDWPKQLGGHGQTRSCPGPAIVSATTGALAASSKSPANLVPLRGPPPLRRCKTGSLA